MTDAHKIDAPEHVVESGLDRDGRKELCDMLGGALASTYVLYHKTHAYHWNVTGPLFYSVHNLTEEQYEDMAAAIDELAERIRALGFPAPIGLKAYTEQSTISDVTETPDAGTMIRELALDNQHIAGSMRKIVEKAEEIGDSFTADFVTGRIGTHEENGWMLSALAMGDERTKTP
ncbi:DNA starvation/stationary phase protection protein [Parvularcula sp. ZS-1/3]|uniref:DNA starvation/stationary phase protection protein n=1 Tax=Parvularcula mediterranea TaxID=2732508 RepID=A0A7Y3RNE2_9PROT|nr:DNA starvation/stationary phase protection protein [Parvularcula mediterranea]NNU17253.1 DNA starvation/stationary phase protection protein [Parvularcula mediterranea]